MLVHIRVHSLHLFPDSVRAFLNHVTYGYTVDNLELLGLDGDMVSFVGSSHVQCGNDDNDGDDGNYADHLQFGYDM